MKRRSRLTVFLVAALFAIAGAAFGKSADDYFRGAASRYVAGKVQEASVEAEEGLRLHPEDAKLRALAEHLRKKKDQQRGNSGKDDSKGGKDKQKQDPQNGQNKPGDPDKKNRDGKNGDRKGDKDDQERKDQDKEQPPKPGQDPRDKQDGKDAEGRKAGKMSEEEAKRLLNSFADDEKKEQAERRRVLRQRAGTEQDW